MVIDSKGNIWISEPGKNKIARLSGFTHDFTLNAYPEIIAVPRGESGTVTIVGTSISGYGGTLTISPVNLPNEVGYSLDPKQISISVGENTSSALVIQVNSTATPETVEVTFLGSDGVIAHSVGILLTITNSTTSQAAKPQCLIATATFGSQLSPQVELLRNFRARDHEQSRSEFPSNLQHLVLFIQPLRRELHEHSCQHPLDHAGSPLPANCNSYYRIRALRSSTGISGVCNSALRSFGQFNDWRILLRPALDHYQTEVQNNDRNMPIHLRSIACMRIIRDPPRPVPRKHRPTIGRRPLHRPFNNVWISRIDGGVVGTHTGISTVGS